MGSNWPDSISVGFPLLISQASRFAQQRDKGIVEKAFADQFFSILKQIGCWFPGFPILNKRLIFGRMAFHAKIASAVY